MREGPLGRLGSQGEKPRGMDGEGGQMTKARARFIGTGLSAALALAACVAPEGANPNPAGRASNKPSGPRPSQGASAPASLPSRDPLLGATPLGLLSVAPSAGLASASPDGVASPLLSFAGTFLLNAGGQILSNHGSGILGNNAGSFHPAVSGALLGAVASFQSNASLIGDAGGELISGDGGADFYRLMAVGDGVATADRSPPDLSKATFDAVFPDGNASRVVVIRHAPVSVKMGLVKGSEATVQGELHQLAHLTAQGNAYDVRLVESLWAYEGSPLGATALELVNPDGGLAFSRAYPLVPRLEAEPTASGTYRLRLKGPMPATAYGLLTIGDRIVGRRAGQNGQMEAPAPEGWASPGASVRVQAFLPADTAASAAVLRHVYYLGGGKL